MNQIFDVWNFILTVKTCVHYFYFCYKNKTLKIYQKCFLFQQKISFCSQDYQIFVLHSFPFFPFLVIANLIEEVIDDEF